MQIIQLKWKKCKAQREVKVSILSANAELKKQWKQLNCPFQEYESNEQWKQVKCQVKNNDHFICLCESNWTVS